MMKLKTFFLFLSFLPISVIKPTQFEDFWKRINQKAQQEYDYYVQAQCFGKADWYMPPYPKNIPVILEQEKENAQKLVNSPLQNEQKKGQSILQLIKQAHEKYRNEQIATQNERQKIMESYKGIC